MDIKCHSAEYGIVVEVGSAEDIVMLTSTVDRGGLCQHTNNAKCTTGRDA